MLSAVHVIKILATDEDYLNGRPIEIHSIFKKMHSPLLEL